MDLSGGGDYFYLRICDGAFVRLPHDAVIFADENDKIGVYDEEAVRVVSASLEEFIRAATPE